MSIRVRAVADKPPISWQPRSSLRVSSEHLPLAAGPSLTPAVAEQLRRPLPHTPVKPSARQRASSSWAALRRSVRSLRTARSASFCSWVSSHHATIGRRFASHPEAWKLRTAMVSRSISIGPTDPPRVRLSRASKVTIMPSPGRRTSGRSPSSGYRRTASLACSITDRAAARQGETPRTLTRSSRISGTRRLRPVPRRSPSHDARSTVRKSSPCSDSESTRAAARREAIAVWACTQPPQAAFMPIGTDGPRLQHPQDQEGRPSSVPADRVVDQQLKETSILQLVVVHGHQKT